LQLPSSTSLRHSRTTHCNPPGVGSCLCCRHILFATYLRGWESHQAMQIINTLVTFLWILRENADAVYQCNVEGILTPPGAEASADSLFRFGVPAATALGEPSLTLSKGKTCPGPSFMDSVRFNFGLALISRFFLRNFGPFSRNFFFAFSAKFSPFFLGFRPFLIGVKKH